MNDRGTIKEIFDTVNSVSWFMMDAMWMLQVTSVAELMVPVVALSGLALCFLEQKASLVYVNCAVFSWIIMNACWMISEVHNVQGATYFSYAAFFSGLVFMTIAALKAQSVSETFSHFKRFRIKKFFE